MDVFHWEGTVSHWADRSNMLAGSIEILSSTMLNIAGSNESGPG